MVLKPTKKQCLDKLTEITAQRPELFESFLDANWKQKLCSLVKGQENAVVAFKLGEVLKNGKLTEQARALVLLLAPNLKLNFFKKQPFFGKKISNSDENYLVYIADINWLTLPAEICLLGSLVIQKFIELVKEDQTHELKMVNDHNRLLSAYNRHLLQLLPFVDDRGKRRDLFNLFTLTEGVELEKPLRVFFQNLKISDYLKSWISLELENLINTNIVSSKNENYIRVLVEYFQTIRFCATNGLNYNLNILNQQIAFCIWYTSIIAPLLTEDFVDKVLVILKEDELFKSTREILVNSFLVSLLESTDRIVISTTKQYMMYQAVLQEIDGGTNLYKLVSNAIDNAPQSIKGLF